jgi:hypothetical protein
LYRQGNSISISIEGRPAPPPGQEDIIVTRIISPGYFDTMSIPLLKGRQLTDQDTDNSPNVVVISEGMARRYWPGEEAVGKRIAVGRVESPEDWIQVVGVVKDVRQFELTADPKPQMYLTHRQFGFFDAQDLVVKTDVDSEAWQALFGKLFGRLIRTSRSRTFEQWKRFSPTRSRDNVSACCCSRSSRPWLSC